MSPLRSKALYLLLASWLLAGLFLFDLFGMAMAMAAMASEVEAWPFYLVLIPGVMVTALTAFVVRKLERKPRRRIQLALTPPALLYLLFVTWIGYQELETVKERFIIPASYHGNVYVFHSVRGATSSATGWHKRTYILGSDGIAVVSDSIAPLSQASYFDRMPDSSLQRIPNTWYSTIPDTPENRTDERDRGMYYPRTGSGGTANCTASFEEFFIGTKAEILANKSPDNVTAKFEHHPELCPK